MPDERAAPVSGVILAAGASVRMGRPKQLLRIDGRGLLDTVIDAALASRLDEVVVVLGAHADAIRSESHHAENPGVRFVVNAAHALGMSTSLRVGVAACEGAAEGAAILLADQPRVVPWMIDAVLDAFRRARAPIVRPLFRGPDGVRVPGHPVVLARSVWPLLDTVAGDEGARALIRRHPELVETVEVAAELPEDIDTVDDYRRARGGAAVG